MGLIRTCLVFMVGSACGVYIAQNYSVPNIRKMADNCLLTAKKIEETYRKPQSQPPQINTKDEDLPQ